MALSTLYQDYLNYFGRTISLAQFKNVTQGTYYALADLTANHALSWGSNSQVDKTRLNSLTVGQEWVFWAFKNGNEFIIRRGSGEDQINVGFTINGVTSYPFNFSQGSFFLTARHSYITIADDGSGHLFLALLQGNSDNSQFSVTNLGGTLTNQDTYVRALIDGSEKTQDPYQTAPDSEPDGGYGDFDYSGDSVLPPNLPAISVADSGFVTLYAPSLTQLQDLAQYMWSGLFDLSTFRKIFADPMDCIISLNILPCDLPTGEAQELKVGNIGTGQVISILSDQFIKIVFATMTKEELGVRTNSFMDYSPYVKAQLFLPFIGARSISIDEIANADNDIEYHIDLFSGACAAYVTITKSNSDDSVLNSTLYQFNGNVCANVPFTATNYNGFLSSLLGTAAAVTTAIATQGSSSAIAGALSSGIDTATAIKPDVERSGNMSATNGFLGIQKPYLIITYPHVCKPVSRDKTVGTPSFIGLSDNKHLSSFHGFTRLHKINVKGIPCTEEERQMIETLLTGEGVIMP